VRLVSLIAPPLCAACRRPGASEGVLCRACAGTLERLEPAAVPVAGMSVWAPVSYVGPARAIVRRLKFHGATALAGHMAASMAAGAPEEMLRYPLVPVPSPARRRRARGFCHAALLAEALGEQAGLPVLELLERVGAGRQVGRARSQRVRTPPRFIALRRGIGPVVLVDDVITTGATLSVCARALRRFGCSCEGALAYARTPVR
jgi:predicted amidophosphoribosyltransferase